MSDVSNFFWVLRLEAEWQSMADWQRRAAVNELRIRRAAMGWIIETHNEAAQWLNRIDKIKEEADTASRRWGLEFARQRQEEP